MGPARKYPPFCAPISVSWLAADVMQIGMFCACQG
jgi:hypothetical protein